MVDKIRPLKIENPAEGGTQTDYLPTETNAQQDYVSALGIAFQELDTFRIEKLGRILTELVPDYTINIHYTANHDISYLEYFNSATQITANRILRIDISYDGNFFPLTNVVTMYDNDGSSILRTITYSFTYTSGDLTGISTLTT